MLNKSVALGAPLKLVFIFHSKSLRIRPGPLSVSRLAAFRVESNAQGRG
jgi:hypothetical protein